MIKDTLKLSKKFRKKINKLIIEAKEYTELIKAFQKKEGWVDIDVPFLLEMAEIIALFPYVKSTVIKTDDAYEITSPVVNDIKKVIMDNYNQGIIDKTT